MTKDQLTKHIYLFLNVVRLGDNLECTDKEMLSMAKHISKMPKKARISFLNSLAVLTGKASEYDMMYAEEEEEDMLSNQHFASGISDWNT